MAPSPVFALNSIFQSRLFAHGMLQASLLVLARPSSQSGPQALPAGSGDPGNVSRRDSEFDSIGMQGQALATVPSPEPRDFFRVLMEGRARCAALNSTVQTKPGLFPAMTSGPPGLFPIATPRRSRINSDGARLAYWVAHTAPRNAIPRSA